MSDDRALAAPPFTAGWRSALILGGIRSGKSAFAEQALAAAPGVRYLATAALPAADDPAWQQRIAAHRARRPAAWRTEEYGEDPDALVAALRTAGPDDVLLVDDLGGWVTALLERDPQEVAGAALRLAEAVAGCPGRVLLVSPEVGLTLVATTGAGRAFTDVLGALNQSVAQACDHVLLVVAGQPVWLKQDTGRPLPAGPGAGGAATVALAGPAVDARLPADLDPPLPDDLLAADVRERLAAALPGLGGLHRVVTFTAGARGVAAPPPFRDPAVVVLHAAHEGAVAAGDGGDDAALRALLAAGGPLATLAGRAGARVEVLALDPAAPIEDGPAMTAAGAREAAAQGHHLARRLAETADVLVLAATGTGTVGAATAVLAALGRGEPAALLPRVVDREGVIDDVSWMRRCAAVRDAVYRSGRDADLFAVLAEVGGPDIAAAAGVVLAAAGARTPVLVDGPVGAAGVVAASELAPDVRRWCLVPDEGRGPLLAAAAQVLGQPGVVRLGLDLGEGATALSALPLVNAALAVAGPALADGQG